jgi:DNA-directed RNA polymerase specialized sigma subunit
VIDVSAKEYLLQIKYLTNDIREQEDYIQRLIESLSIAGLRYDREKVQCSSEPDKFAYIFAQIDEQEEVLEGLKEDLIEMKVKIINMIHELENEKHRKLLNIVYVDMKSLKKAANIMCFSYEYVKELHGEALNAFSEKFLP